MRTGVRRLAVAELGSATPKTKLADIIPNRAHNFQKFSNRRSTPGASGSIMETLTTGGSASENMMSSVIRKVIALHTDRL